MKPSLIVHGGAWDIPDALIDACKEGCRRALAAGWQILTRGGSALDAVTAAIVVLEDDPVFDAGYGSHLNLDGQVECDAIVMDGATLRAGSIAAVKRIRNPIRAARALLEHGPHMMLVAEGAERYAAAHGIALCDPRDLISPAEQAAWHKCRATGHQAAYHIPASHNSDGTVGAVALDSHGSLVAATSTGGTCCKLPGRVGDSPLIGCGCYADSETGAASATGRGESIMKVVLSKYAVDLLRPSPSDVGARHAVPVLSPPHVVNEDVNRRAAVPAPLPCSGDFTSPSSGPDVVGAGFSPSVYPEGDARRVCPEDASRMVHPEASARRSASLPRSDSSPSDMPLYPEGSARRAAHSALAHLTHKTTGTAGLILLDRHGTPAAAHTTSHMAHAYVTPDGSFLSSV